MALAMNGGFLDGIQINAPGTQGSGQNTITALNNSFALGQYNALGLQALLGANNNFDDSGSGVVGGQSPNLYPQIAGSGSAVSQTCMYDTEQNNYTGNSTLNQVPGSLGCTSNGCPCGGGNNQTGQNPNGLNTDVSDSTDPTDFLYTDNADSF